MTSIPDQAQNRWRNILPALGVSADFLRNRHGPCPMCEGKDRWRFDDKDGRGTWFCTHCGAGDGVKLVMLRLGLDFKAACAEIAKHIGAAEPQEKRKARTAEDKREMLKRVWAAAVPLDHKGPASRYLWRRCAQAWPTSWKMEELRYAERCAYKDGPQTTFHPALLARVRAFDGKPVNIHRTYLNADGYKADLPEPKRTMEGTLPQGCAVRLYPAAAEMGVAEGIETALSAARMFRMPVWSTLNATLLGKWSPPPECEHLTIFGDNDASYTGQAVAFGLAKRLLVEASKAKRSLTVKVRVPRQCAHDWNDVHQEMLRDLELHP